MNTITRSINDPTAFQSAEFWLHQSMPVAFPTDTVYGLGCFVNDETAIEKLFKFKERSTQKAIAVLVADIDQAKTLAETFPANAVELAKAFWPGALTLILKARATLPKNLSPLPTIGIRMPAYPPILDFMKNVGPLATTSANLSGGENPASAEEVLAQFNGKIPLILDGGPTRSSIASTVVDCSQEPFRILREGQIGLDVAKFL